MSIELQETGSGQFLTIQLNGKLHKADYDRFVPAIEEAIRQRSKVRMLVEMRDFHGWDAGALWEDVKFDAKHFNHIERLAIVGEKAWEKWMAIFCRPFTTAKVRFFRPAQIERAREWLSEATA